MYLKSLFLFVEVDAIDFGYMDNCAYVALILYFDTEQIGFPLRSVLVTLRSSYPI